MTFSEMQNYVTATLGLQDIDSYDETGMVSMWLNQGVIDLLSRTRCVVRCVDLRVQSGVGTYTLDHAILALIDSENGLWPGRRYRAARAETPSFPAFVLIRADVLEIEPTPSEDGTVQVWAVMKPQSMSAPTDDPGQEQFGAIPPEYHDAIVTYALWKCADYSDDATSQQGERYRSLYEGADGRGGRLNQIKILVNRRGTSFPPPRRVRLHGVSSSGAYVG